MADRNRLLKQSTRLDNALGIGFVNVQLVITDYILASRIECSIDTRGNVSDLNLPKRICKFEIGTN